MKITFILPKLTEKPTGGGKIVYQYASLMAEAGHDVEVVHPDTLFLWDLKKSRVLRWLSLCRDIARVAIRPWGKRAGKVGWIDVHPDVKISIVPTLIQRYMPDADVVVASLWRTAEFVEQYPQRKGAKFYLIQHHETWSGPVERVNRTLRSRMNKIVISRWLGELVTELSGDVAHYVPNPVDHGEFHLTAPLEPRGCVVSMLYSPHEWKGARDGIAAIEQARVRFPDLAAVLFGLAPRPEGLPAWITYERQPDRKTLRERIYNASSVYLCPSWSEGWGLPVLEAMACGCAIVTTDNGGIRDFVEHGANGFVVPPRSPGELGAALVRLLEDSRQRIAFSHRSIDIAQRFTLAASASKLRAVFAAKRGESNALEMK
jgi:L-malate glycosyltransferase